MALEEELGLGGACGTHGPPEAFLTDGPPEACGTHGPPEAFLTPPSRYKSLGVFPRRPSEALGSPHLIRPYEAL